MNYSSYLLLGIVFITVACNKDNELFKKPKQVTIPSEISSLWSAAAHAAYESSLPVDGYMMIGNNSTHLNQTSIPGNHIYVDGFILNSSGIGSDFGSFSIDSRDFITASLSNGHYGYQLLPGTVDFSYLFGNTNAYSLVGNPSSGYPGFSNESLYFPDALLIFSPSYKFGQIDTTQVNDFITWNADSRNSIGVNITLEYDPIDNVPNGLVTNHPNTIFKSYHVPDSGSFQLSSSVLSNFPAGAKLEVQLGRGNYKRVVASGTSTYYIGIINYTKIRTLIQLED